jgi:hypothetical protein
MVTSDLVVRTLNGFAEQEMVEQQPSSEDLPEQEQVTEAIAIEEQVDAASDVPELEPQDADQESDDEADEEDEPTLRRSARQAAGVKAPERYAHATKICSKEWSQEATKRAIEGEVQQVFKDLKALDPVMYAEIPKGAEILSSHMFVVEKFTADGSHEKTKARLVTHGNLQDATLYPNKSSPTAAIHSLFTVMALFAGKGREMAKVDIKGAFIQTPMSGTPVYVRVSKNVSKYVVEMFPEWEKYLTKDGVLYTRMLKAMYGCVQASRLWFELLTGVLRDAGYVSAAMDECVMAKEGNVITIYVDDLLIFAEKREIEALRALLMDKFQWITMVVENSVSYLGMQIDRWDNQFEVGMDVFVQKLLAPYESLPVRGTPGTRVAYQVDGSSA